MASGSWAPASGCDNRVEGKGGKREKSNREYSSKVLASKDLHYICIGINEMDTWIMHTLLFYMLQDAWSCLKMLVFDRLGLPPLF